MRVPLEIDGDKGQICVAKITVFRFLQCLIHLRYRYLLFHLHNNIHQRNIGGGHPDRQAVKLPLQFWNNKCHGCCCTGTGRNHGKGSGPCPTQIRVGKIENSLITGIGMDGGHKTTLNPEIIQDHLGYRSKTVGGTGCIGDHMMNGAVILILIYSHNKCFHISFGRSRDHDLTGPCTDMLLSAVTIPEQTGTLGNILYTSSFPWDIGGITMVGHQYSAAINGEAILITLHLTIINPHHRIIFQKVGEGSIICEIIDRGDLNICKCRIFCKGTKNTSPNTAKTINTYLD